MATATYEEADDRGRTPARGTGGSRVTAVRRRTASGLNTAALFDIVDRLGVVDLVIARLKQRLEEVDIDELLDEAGEHLKRNPEILVASLGAITIAAGALVYLNKRNDGATPRRTSGSTKSRSRKSSR